MTSFYRADCEYFSGKSRYRDIIPETRDLTWDDVFFQKNNTEADDIVAVFDFDHDRMIRFWIQKAIARQTFLLIMVSILFSSQYAADEPILSLLPTLLYILSGTPFFLFSQARWKAHSMHCAVTRDGIKLVIGPQKTLLGLPVCTKKNKTKMIRFEEVKDCEVFEPIGNVYFCIPDALTKVIVDKNWRGQSKPEIILSGLKDPYSLKKLVWAMKRDKEVTRLITHKALTVSKSNLQSSISDLTYLEMPDV